MVGETPYAEGGGDTEDLGLSAEDVAAIAEAKRAGRPLVVVLVCGRAMILGDVLEKCDALVVAWLPGSEGQGVAEALFGDHAPTGRLSFTCPRSRAQVPIHRGDAPYDPLFAEDFGLTFS